MKAAEQSRTSDKSGIARIKELEQRVKELEKKEKLFDERSRALTGGDEDSLVSEKIQEKLQQAITGRKEMEEEHEGLISAYKEQSQIIIGTNLELEAALARTKLAEEEVHRLNEGLEQRVIERTAELQAANKELEAFAYSIAHDLRAPLRGIDGFSQILMDDYAESLDAEGKEYLQRVRAASQRMAKLIDGLLRLSMVTRQEINREPVNLSSLVREITTEIQMRQPDRQVEFFIEDGLFTDGDAYMLRVVLENLLRNAWKYTGRNTSARIEFGITMHNGERAFFVRDDGAGFDMAYADKLFGAFQRLHSETEFEGTGTGAGLATVQRIIHRHGGQIWAEGTVGKGATFYFTL